MKRYSRLISIIMIPAAIMILGLAPGSSAQDLEAQTTADFDEQMNNWPATPDCYLAQIDQTAPPGGQDQQPRQRRKHLEQLRMLKLLELLDLDTEQETGFIVAFRHFRKGLRGIHRHRIEVIDRMAAGIKAESATSEEIYEAIAGLEKLGKERLTLENSFVEKARKLLDAQQLGKLVVFKERFEQALIQDVKAFHDRPGHGHRGGW